MSKGYHASMTVWISLGPPVLPIESSRRSVIAWKCLIDSRNEIFCKQEVPGASEAYDFETSIWKEETKSWVLLENPYEHSDSKLQLSHFTLRPNALVLYESKNWNIVEKRLLQNRTNRCRDPLVWRGGKHENANWLRDVKNVFQTNSEGTHPQE